MAAQIQLANTFNEFRQAYNDAANDITTLQGLTGGTGSANVTGLTINTFTNPNRIPVVGANGTLIVDAGFQFDTSTTNLTVGGQVSGGAFVGTANANFVGSLTAANVTANNLTSGRIVFAGTSGFLSDDADLTFNTANNSLSVANVVIGNGNTLLYSNGYFVSANDINLIGANSRIDSYHIHADWHVGVGGDVEAWAAGKGTDPDQHKIFGIGDADAPVDMLIVNESDGINAYAEFIAVNDEGDIENGWISMGINSSNYAAAAYGITKADDGYLLYQAPDNTTANGDLVIGTGGNGVSNRIIFSANGFDDPANNTQLIIIPGQQVHIEIDTESTSTTTGALRVAGGMGLTGNLNVGGNVTITGAISLLGSGNTVSTDSLSVSNSLLFLANGNASDILDVGVIGEYTQGTRKYFGLVRDQTDGVFKLYQDGSTKPANNVNFDEAGINYGSVLIGALNASNTTASTDTTSGAIKTAGGLGVAGNINAGGYIKTTDTTASTSTSSGALIIAGGAGVAGNTHIGGTLNVSGVTTLSSNVGLSGVTGNFTVHGNPTFVGSTTFTGAVRLQDLVEDVVDVSPSTNQYSLDFTAGNIFYASSAPAADFQVLATNVPTDNGRISTLSLILPQGATGRRPVANTISINGTNTLINWVGGNTSITPTNSRTDIFNFTILRRASAFTVAGTISANTAL